MRCGIISSTSGNLSHTLRVGIEDEHTGLGIHADGQFRFTETCREKSEDESLVEI
jgi:hypothetical protein